MKMSELDMDRQRVEHLRSDGPPPNYAWSSRKDLHVIPPPPAPTTIEKGGVPNPGAMTFLLFVAIAFFAIAGLSILTLKGH